MKRGFTFLLAAFLFGVLVSGCGQKGPLYLPGRSSTFESMTPGQQPSTDDESEEDTETEEQSENTDQS